MSTLTDCALRNVNATTVAASRHPDLRPAEKLRTKEIRDNCPNITNFLCQQTYITISTKYTGDNQPLKSLSLHL